MKHTLLFPLFGLLLICGAACKGEKGDTGPAGRDGSGAEDALTQTVRNWTYAAPSWTANILVPDITQAIVDQGAVLVYWKNPANQWAALPVTTYSLDWYTSTLDMTFAVGAVTVRKTDSDLTKPVDPGPQTFKIVTITGEGMVVYDDLDWADYEVVADRLQLPD